MHPAGMCPKELCPHHVLLLRVAVAQAVELAKGPVVHKDLPEDAAPGVERLQRRRAWGRRAVTSLPLVEASTFKVLGSLRGLSLQLRALQASI